MPPRKKELEVSLPAAQVERLKTLAAERGVPIDDLVGEAIEAFYADQMKPAGTSKKEANAQIKSKSR